MGDTTIRYDGSSNAFEATPSTKNARERATLCPSCHRRFSEHADFCPFDGERLKLHEPQSLETDELIGGVIDDRYEVLSVIGEGGMGRVYRVRHRRLGRSFALKALRLELARDSLLTQRFVQEARAAAVVVHPNVVQINDFGNLPTGQPYFVMELLEGRTLARVLREEGPLEPLRSISVARQIAEALGAAHAMGVIHRDLKPDNVILIRPKGAQMTVKVLDFGLAKVAVSSKLTRPGVVFGTPYYMSPEQASGEPCDHRVDIYALGVMLFEMVTGRVPFEADTYMGVLSKHQYFNPPKLRPTHARAGTVRELEEIISRCLAKKPAERWPNMNELARTLTGLATQLEITSRAGQLSLIEYPRERRAHAPRFLALYALAVSAYIVCGLTLFGLQVSRRLAPKSPTRAERVLPNVAIASALALDTAALATNVVATSQPQQPLISEAAAARYPVQESPSGIRAPGLPPPVGKHGRTAAKPKPPNKKNQPLGSGDLADPWAK